MGEETQMDAFAAVIHQNDIYTAHKLLAQGIDPNSYSHFFGRAINVAAKQGHLDMVKILLRAGAFLDQNSSAFNHDDAVQTAALAGREDTLKFLVQVLLDSDCSRLPLCVHTTQPYFTGNGMHTVLRCAIRSGKQDLCMWLLEKTFSHKDLISTKEYRIIFYEAAGSGRIETMQLLLRPVRRSWFSKGDVAEALRQATRSGSQEVVKLLLSYRFYEDYSNSGENGLPNSARDKHEDFVRDLVKPETLCTAAAKGTASIVELLLEHGAEPHSRFEEETLIRAKITSSTANILRENAYVVLCDLFPYALQHQVRTIKYSPFLWTGARTYIEETWGSGHWQWQPSEGVRLRFDIWSR